jgi:hypothetical protein
MKYFLTLIVLFLTGACGSSETPNKELLSLSECQSQGQSVYKCKAEINEPYPANKVTYSAQVLILEITQAQ